MVQQVKIEKEDKNEFKCLYLIFVIDKVNDEK